MKDAHYKIIKSAYDDFYKELMKKGQLPLKDTGIGYWGISVADEVFEFFKKHDLKQYKKFLDLGAGDFKVAFIASLFTEASGIEFDKWLCEQGQNVQKKLSHIASANQTKIIEGDFMKADLSPYDVIFLNPDQNNRALSRKLKKEFSGTLIVHGPHYHPEDFEKKETYCINGTYFFTY